MIHPDEIGTWAAEANLTAEWRRKFSGERVVIQDPATGKYMGRGEDGNLAMVAEKSKAFEYRFDADDVCAQLLQLRQTMKLELVPVACDGRA